MISGTDCAGLRAEVERLKAKAAAFDEWLAKTEWVQETAQARDLGKHRADVMRERIESLQDAGARDYADMRRMQASYREADRARRALIEDRDTLQAEVERLRQDAERYRWLAGHCRSTSEHWGGRWSIVVEGPTPKTHDSEDDFDAAVDAAREGE